MEKRRWSFWMLQLLRLSLTNANIQNMDITTKKIVYFSFHSLCYRNGWNNFYFLWKFAPDTGKINWKSLERTENPLPVVIFPLTSTVIVSSTFIPTRASPNQINTTPRHPFLSPYLSKMTIYIRLHDIHQRKGVQNISH